MKRALLFPAFVLLLLAASTANASIYWGCRTQTVLVPVTTEYGDGTTITNYQWGTETYCGWIDDGYNPFRPPGGGGGPGGGPSTDPALTSLVSEYDNLECSQYTKPTSGDFVTAGTYADPGNFPFSEMKSPNYDYALLKPALLNGLQCMRNGLGSAIHVTSGYRSPVDIGVGCSSHKYGLGADLSIRDANSRHSCAVWNQLASLAKEAGAWVESIEEMFARQGSVDHVHIDFRGTTNDYGTCVDSKLP